ncbi:hypothetical protein CEXT_234571, partial [Caerostris extrusa]
LRRAPLLCQSRYSIVNLYSRFGIIYNQTSSAPFVKRASDGVTLML